MPQINITKCRLFRRLLTVSQLKFSHHKQRYHLVAEPLTERTLIKISGENAGKFLQGLTTNDIRYLEEDHQSVYTVFLNNAGKVLYDSIIYKTSEPESFILECDKHIERELRRHLKLYLVRRKMDITSLASEYAAWAVFDKDTQNSNSCTKSNVNGDQQLRERIEEEIKQMENVLISSDPRLNALGFRVIMPTINNIEQHISKIFPDCKESDKDDYKYLRYKLGIGEGVIDYSPGKCFPFEINADYLNGISYSKGCYIGQELTARVHNTGVVRKRLLPIKLEKENIDEDTNEVRNAKGGAIGVVRSRFRDYALGILRLEHVLKSSEVFIGQSKGHAIFPNWFPQNPLPSRQVASSKI